MRLREWERGIAVEDPTAPESAVYLWFYEWHLFDAVVPGEHTRGSFRHPREVAADAARIEPPGMKLEADTAEDGAWLTLTVENTSEHDWPEEAAIIPCFNPGPKDAPNTNFQDHDHTRTYFLGEDGLRLLEQREIHFNHALAERVTRWANDGDYEFTYKWPHSDHEAMGGILVRESVDGKWVAAIAWDRYLSAQGHNPWNCMHLSIRVGALKPGETKTVRGRIYVMQADKIDVLKRYRSEFCIQTDAP
jgi:hypothetical protein